MKKLGVLGLAVLIGCFMFAGAAVAAEPGRLVGGNYVQDGYVPLPLHGFSKVGTLGSAHRVTDTSVPGFEYDDSRWGIVWADGETSPIMQNFMVPQNYGGNGRFIVEATQSATGTTNEFDFDVYINSEGNVPDTFGENQTPVALTNNSTNSPTRLVLVPATDFSTLSGGHWITFRGWRDDTATGTADLEMKSVAFIYDPLP
jgi:hypothetical protein